MARGHLSESAKADLWDCVFLTRPEIDDLLKHVQDAARHPFVYPMFVFAAHTGARRSEILRSELEDINLADGFILIRERKRARGKLTTRRVPASPLLSRVLAGWLKEHPGGRSTFCHQLHVPHSTTIRLDFGPITRSEATDHFKRTLAGSKWDKLRGWHVLRHSFCSNCAAAGIDQRVINTWVGHQTEEMVRRYRHLIPSQEKMAIESVFGNGQPGALAPQ